jgi:hypothetical protein
VRRFLPELWRQKNWLLYNDNAPIYTSFSTNYNMTVVPHPPYLLLFLQLQINLKCRHRNALTEHGFQDAFKNSRSTGNGACSRKGTTSKIVASGPEVSFLQDGSTSPRNYGWLVVLKRSKVAQSEYRMATGWKTGGLEFDSRWGSVVLFSMPSTLILEPTQHSYQFLQWGYCYRWHFLPLQSDRDINATTHLQPAPRLRTYGSAYPLLHMT